jgi:CRP/FNR family cyclic AMP-dependent transcriptional regulator
MRKALYILGQLNDADVQWLADHGLHRQLTPGQVIIREGAPIDSLFITLDGALVVSLQNGHEVARLGAGEIVGEIAFVDSAPPSATVAAADATRVLEIRKPDLTLKLSQDSEFAARFYRALAVFLADRLRATTRQLGYGKAADLEQEGRLEDELDSAVLDTVAGAGERFRRLLRALAAKPRN